MDIGRVFIGLIILPVLLIFIGAIFFHALKMSGRFWFFLFGRKSEEGEVIQYGFLSGFVNVKWWVCVIFLSIINSFTYHNSEDRLKRQYDNEEKYYIKAKSEIKYLEEQLNKGTVCNDGWRSSSSGQGTCSHHGGVDNSINYSKYESLKSATRSYEFKRSYGYPYNRFKSIKETHFWAEVIIIFGLLFLYMILKNSEQ